VSDPTHYNTFFSEALKLAEQASLENEVPIGCVIVKENRIIARAYNQTEKKGSFTAHAELQCLQEAATLLQTKYLNECDLFITLEPCLMCLTAARLSRINAIYYLVASEKFGTEGIAYPPVKVHQHTSPLADEIKLLLRRFFENRR